MVVRLCWNLRVHQAKTIYIIMVNHKAKTYYRYTKKKKKESKHRTKIEQRRRKEQKRTTKKKIRN